ncbi:ABC transporter substrate-binding protein [Paraburkholderia sp. IW21]|uniref:ABC transporter substrate-binding protein n=1 Tax=Paraburkholderia sp. IW21 TaxID=3242488 RepID=UPI0035217075
MRKRLASTIAATLAVLLCSVRSAAADTITVATYGGEWGDAIRDCISQPFEKSTGNRVIPEPGVSGVTLAKLKQQAGNPTIDAAWLDGGISELAADAGLLADLDIASMPNLKDVVRQGIYKSRDGKIYAVSTGFYALGLVYNARDVKVPPTSWNDLWKPEYQGVVTIPAVANAMGIPFLLAINKLAGGSGTDVSKGLAKISTLKTFGFFDTAGNATNSFQSSEVDIGAAYASGAWALADQKLPIAYAVPKEGAIGGDIRLHIVRNTKHLKTAQAFVNFAVAPAQAACMSNRLYIGPATQGVKLTDTAAARMPWGKGGSIANLILTDWTTVNAQRGEIAQRWNETLAR